MPDLIRMDPQYDHTTVPKIVPMPAVSAMASAPARAVLFIFILDPLALGPSSFNDTVP